MTPEERRQRELEELGLVQDPEGYVLVKLEVPRCWPAMAWLRTLNRAVLEYFEETIPQGASIRGAMRVIRASRNQRNLPEMWRRTVAILERENVESLTPEQVTERGGVIAGVIPLDKATALR